MHVSNCLLIAITIIFAAIPPTDSSLHEANLRRYLTSNNNSDAAADQPGGRLFHPTVEESPASSEKQDEEGGGEFKVDSSADTPTETEPEEQSKRIQK